MGYFGKQTNEPRQYVSELTISTTVTRFAHEWLIDERRNLGELQSAAKQLVSTIEQLDDLRNAVVEQLEYVNTRIADKEGIAAEFGRRKLTKLSPLQRKQILSGSSYDPTTHIAGIPIDEL